VKMKTSQPGNPVPSYTSPYGAQASTGQLNPYSATNSVRTLAGQAQDNQVSQADVLAKQTAIRDAETARKNTADDTYNTGILNETINQNKYNNNRNTGNDAIGNAVAAAGVTGNIPTVLANIPVKIDTPTPAPVIPATPTDSTFSSVNPTSISSTLPVSSGIQGATNVMRNVDGGYSYTDSTGHYQTYKPPASSTSTSGTSSVTLPDKAGVTGATNVVKLANGSYTYTSAAGSSRIYHP